MTVTITKEIITDKDIKNNNNKFKVDQLGRNRE